jgi:hypothetical protein
MSTAARLPLLAALAVAGALAASLAAGPLPSARGQDPKKPADGDAPKKVSLDSILKGSITSFDGTVAEVRYDFSDPAQMEDFPDFRPFNLTPTLKKEWIDKSIHLTGTGGIAWKPVFRKKVEMDFTVRLKVPRDFGAFLAEDRASDERTLYSIYDLFFQRKDKPGNSKTHMICRLTAHAPDAHGDYAFRYVTRSASPHVDVMKPVKVRIAREGNDEFFEIDGSKLNGSDANWPLLQGMRPGFYVIDSDATVTDVTIRGDIDPKWAEAAGVDLSLTVKPKVPGRTPEREPNEADLAAKQRIDAVRKGAEGPGALIPLLGNPLILESVREDAAKAMEDAGDARVVGRLVPTLESQDLETRKLGALIVTKLAGRNFGFIADGPEDGRRKAVQSLLEFIKKNPGKFN